MRWKWVFGTAGLLILLLSIGIWVRLSRYDYNAFKPRIAQWAKQATGRELILAGDINFKLGLTPALTVADVHFRNAAWGTRPDAIEAKRVEIQIGLLALLRRTLDVKRLIVIEPSVLFEIDPQGRSNLAWQIRKPAGKASLTTRLEGLGVNDVRILNGRFTFKDARSKRQYVITRATLKATAEALDQPLKFDLQGNLRGQHMTTTGTLGPLTALLKAEQPWPIQLHTRIAGLTLHASGSIQDPLTASGLSLDLVAAGQDFKPIEVLIGHPIPLPGPFRFAGHVVDSAPKTLQLQQAEMALGDNKLSGTLQAELGKARPFLTASLASSKLDLRPFLPPAAPSAVKKTKVFPAQPLPLNALQTIDADISMQIDALLLPHLVLHQLNVKARIENGRLRLKPIQAILGGGTLDGHFSLRPAKDAAAMAAVMQITRFNVGQMLKELGISEQVEGQLDADFDLKGHGASLAAVMSKLDGSTNVVMGKGQLDNRYIELLGGDLSAGLIRLIKPSKGETNSTAINCFVSRFNIKDGLAESTALLFDTRNMSMIGAGTIDLKTERLDLSLKSSPKDGVGSQQSGNVNLSLGELAKPFKLGGTLANPALAIDPAQTALMIGKTVGGIALFGPIGIAAALIGTSSGADNPCLAALDAAQQQLQAGKTSGPTRKRNWVSKTSQGLKNFGSKLNKLFGTQSASHDDQTETDTVGGD